MFKAQLLAHREVDPQVAPHRPGSTGVRNRIFPVPGSGPPARKSGSFDRSSRTATVHTRAWSSRVPLSIMKWQYSRWTLPEISKYPHYKAPAPENAFAS